MTLIVAMVNRRQAVLVSDRRVSRDGRVVHLPYEPEDESNKSFVLMLQDARLCIAFTGLASDGNGFLTKRWLPEALMESAAPDYLMGPTIQRFTERASRDFAKLSATPPLDKRLSVVFAGFHYNELPARAYCWLISNFEDFDGAMLAGGNATAEFNCSFKVEKRPCEEAHALVKIIGHSRAFGADAMNSLHNLLMQDKPPRALVDKAVELIRESAKSFRTENTIGQQCSSLVLPSNPNEEAVGEYHSANPARTLYYPTFIKAQGGGGAVYTIAEPSSEVHVEGQPTVISVPRVGRNHPCPCGSGKKYKTCHGRPATNKQKGYMFQFGGDSTQR
jgi:hypothetical protein